MTPLRWRVYGGRVAKGLRSSVVELVGKVRACKRLESIDPQLIQHQVEMFFASDLSQVDVVDSQLSDIL
jgi:hypothetical protein